VRAAVERNLSDKSVRCTDFMDIAKLISNLRHELELVNHAIRSLEPLVPKTSARRGRPKKSVSPYLQQPIVPDSVPKNSGRRASGHRVMALSAGGIPQQPEAESGRKGANNA
jgi:hypothetical protein